jgi:F-type H+-transporting ATPase subunit delta
MADITYARRYAQAVLELALEHNELDLWRQDLTLLGELWTDADLRAYLEDVRISKQARLQRARERLGGYISARALNMVQLLISRGRTSLIPYIARQFADLERQRERKVVAHVTSAVALTPPQQVQLIKHLSERTGKDVELQTNVDPAILGGLVIKVGDQLLDSSVIGTLTRMREQVVGRDGAGRR